MISQLHKIINSKNDFKFLTRKKKYLSEFILVICGKKTLVTKIKIYLSL